MVGIFHGQNMIPSMSMTGKYFSKRRGLAIGIANCGGGVGPVLGRTPDGKAGVTARRHRYREARRSRLAAARAAALRVKSSHRSF